MTCGELFAKFGLEKGTIDFIGHSLALYDNDKYISTPAQPMIERS
jgi:Rab GDP dissociation inhibitor